MFVTDVARRIKEARLAKNLTQMNVADALGVSYQAVSNWERGNSMPDISKLGDLSELLGVSIEELLGKSRQGEIVKSLAEDGAEQVEADISELTEIMPILPPDMAKEVVEKEAEEKGIDISELIGLVPFLPEETVDRLALSAARAENIEDLLALAPFVSRKTLGRIAKGVKVDNLEMLVSLAPFLREEDLERIAGEFPLENVGELAALAPFLGSEAVVRLIDRAGDNVSAEDLACLAPFLDSGDLVKIVERLIKRKL